MAHTKTRSGKATPPAVFVFFSILTLAVGIVLFAVRQTAARESESAKNWIATPCVIETSRWVHTDDGKSLEFVYRYRFHGREYRGDRLDLMAGSMGSDWSWEQVIYDRSPEGSQAVCYVNPDDPEISVFDRDHARQNLRNVGLLGFPFLFAGVAFLLASLRGLAAKRSAAGLDGGIANTGKRRRSMRLARTKRRPAHTIASEFEGASSAGTMPGPPPRRLGWLNAAVVLAGAGSASLVWIFFVAFSFVFVILEGPMCYARLFGWQEAAEAHVRGRVTHVQAEDGHELHVPVFEYAFTYDIDGKSYRGTSFTRGKAYQPGDEVDLVYDPQEPSQAEIAGARPTHFTWWHSVIPLSVVILLGMGLVGMYVHNFRALRLLWFGEATQAKTRAQTIIGSSDPEVATNQGGALSNYQFQVGGQTFTARYYSLASKNEAADEAVVLYHAASPGCNVILDDHLKSLLAADRRCSLFQRVLDCLSAPLAVAAVALLLTI
jgi:hypothetical protein